MESPQGPSEGPARKPRPTGRHVSYARRGPTLAPAPQEVGFAIRDFFSLISFSLSYVRFPVHLLDAGREFRLSLTPGLHPTRERSLLLEVFLVLVISMAAESKALKAARPLKRRREWGER